MTHSKPQSTSFSPPGTARVPLATPPGGVCPRLSLYERGVDAASADGVVLSFLCFVCGFTVTPLCFKNSPPYEGGVDAASADGVVLFFRVFCVFCGSGLL